MLRSRDRFAPLIFAAAMLGLFAVLLAGAQVRHMRHDEAIAFAGTSGTIQTTIQFQMQDVHAPLYFAAFHLWQQVFTDNELLARLFSILLSLLTVALVFRLARRWQAHAWAGLCALVGLGLSSYFFVYAIEIRPYAMVMLASAFSVTVFDLWMCRRSWPTALLYGFSVALMFYLHYLCIFLVLMQAIYFAGQFVLKQRPFRMDRTRWQWVGQGVAAAALAFVLWLPWFPVFLSQIRVSSGLLTSGEIRGTGMQFGMASTTLPTTPEQVWHLIRLATNTQPVLIGGILVGGLLLLWRKGYFWLALLWGIGLPATMLTANLIFPIYEPRYASPLIPGFGLLVGLALAAILMCLRWTAIRAAALAAVVVVSLLTVQSGVFDEVKIRDYLRTWQSLYRSGDGVYFDKSIIFDYLGDYQYRHYAPQLWQLMRDKDTQNVSLAALEQGISAPRCVWFVTGSWAEQSTKQIFQTLSRRRPLQRVIGDEYRYLIQELCGPPRVEPRQFGDALRFLGVDMEGANTQQLSLKLWWEVSTAPQLDYSFSLKVLNETGGQIAQADGPITDFYGRGTFQTSWLKPGDLYIDKRTISLPTTLPPGRYRVMLAVYQPWDLARLTIANTPDNIAEIASFTK